MADRNGIFASAFLCEKVLTETNIHSAIRIVDTFTLRLPENVVPGKSLILPLEINFFVSIKSELPRNGEAWVVLESPNGKSLGKFGPFPVSLKGGGHGHYLKVPVILTDWTMPDGLYWFNVLWGEELIQHAPMVLKREQQQSTHPAEDSPSPKQKPENEPPQGE